MLRVKREVEEQGNRAALRGVWEASEEGKRKIERGGRVIPKELTARLLKKAFYEYLRELGVSGPLSWC